MDTYTSYELAFDEADNLFSFNPGIDWLALEDNMTGQDPFSQYTEHHPFLEAYDGNDSLVLSSNDQQLIHSHDVEPSLARDNSHDLSIPFDDDWDDFLEHPSIGLDGVQHDPVSDQTPSDWLLSPSLASLSEQRSDIPDDQRSRCATLNHLNIELQYRERESAMAYQWTKPLAQYYGLQLPEFQSFHTSYS